MRTVIVAEQWLKGVSFGEAIVPCEAWQSGAEPEGGGIVHPSGRADARARKPARSPDNETEPSYVVVYCRRLHGPQRARGLDLALDGFDRPRAIVFSHLIQARLKPGPLRPIPVNLRQFFAVVITLVCRALTKNSFPTIHLLVPPICPVSLCIFDIKRRFQS